MTLSGVTLAGTLAPMVDANVGDPVSVIAPSMIYEEIEIQQTREVVQKPPIVRSPLQR